MFCFQTKWLFFPKYIFFYSSELYWTGMPDLWFIWFKNLNCVIGWSLQFASILWLCLYLLVSDMVKAMHWITTDKEDTFCSWLMVMILVHDIATQDTSFVESSLCKATAMGKQGCSLRYGYYSNNFQINFQVVCFEEHIFTVFLHRLLYFVFVCVHYSVGSFSVGKLILWFYWFHHAKKVFFFFLF